VGVRVGVAYSRARLRNLNLRYQFSIFDSFRDVHVHIYDFLVCEWFVGVKVSVPNFFLDQSIGIDGTIHFS